MEITAAHLQSIKDATEALRRVAQTIEEFQDKMTIALYILNRVKTFGSLEDSILAGQIRSFFENHPELKVDID